MLPGSGRHPNEPFLTQVFLWKLNCNPDLSEALIGIVAYLEPKLWLKK